MKLLFRHFLSRTLLLSLIPMACAAQSPSPSAAPRESLPVTVFKNLEAGKKQTVIAFGTSLTEHGEWVNAVHQYFDKQFPGLVTFINSGGSGQTSEWGVANVQPKVLAYKPDLVFVEFSVNDAATKHNISMDKSQANLDAIVKALRQQNPRVDIVLQTMNSAWDSPNEPSHKKYASDRPHLEDYYAVYRKYAHDHNLPLVDNYPKWHELQHTDEAKFEKWLPEGLHPIPEASLAVTWQNIQALLEKARNAAAH